MYYNRQKCEQLIANSPLFTLDRECDASAYKRESYKMVDALYRYLLSIDERRYEPYGCEIMETAVRCIQRFDPGKGEFLHYFNAAWKKEYSHLMGDQAHDDQFHGMKIAEDDKRNIRKYLKFAESISRSFSGQEACVKIAEAMDLSVYKVQEIARMAGVTVSGDAYGDEMTGLEDKISDGLTLEQQFLSADAVPELLLRIDKAFSDLQTRQKPVISDLLTIRIWPAMPDQYRDVGQFSFISEDIVKIYIETGVMPAQRSIAAKYGRDEASVSRTMNAFLKRVKIGIKQ